MFDKPSLVTRIAVGKAVGFLIGLIGFIALPWLWPDGDAMLRWGILFWYTTVGALIGFTGVFTWHPVLHMPMRWWFRGPVLGAWMNFVLVFFAYDTMARMLTATFGADSALTSPWLFVLEGALVGLLIGWLATRFGGEGPDTVPREPPVDGRSPAA